MKSLSTALRILREFLDNQPDFGVGELAERLDLPKSQVSKILGTFREHGILRQDPATRRYAVGLQAFALGSRFVTFNQLSREALPLMRQLVETTGHSARLSIMDGDEVFYLVGIEGPMLLNSPWRAGARMPLHSTSAGRVMLAFHSPEEVDALLDRCGMPPYTPATVTDRDVLKRMLAETRERGYAVSAGETTPGLGTIAVPVTGEDQAIVGALGLAFAVHVLRDDDVPSLVAALHDAARILSHRMGSPVYPFGGPPPVAPAKPPGRPAPARRKVVSR